MFARWLANHTVALAIPHYSGAYMICSFTSQATGDLDYLPESITALGIRRGRSDEARGSHCAMAHSTFVAAGMSAELRWKLQPFSQASPVQRSADTADYTRRRGSVQTWKNAAALSPFHYPGVIALISPTMRSASASNGTE